MKTTKFFLTGFTLVSFLVIVSCSDEGEDPMPTNGMNGSVTVNITSTTDANGCGEATGSLTATAMSDSGDSFSFSIDGSNFQNSGTFNDLLPGEYTVTARDEDGNIGTSDPMMILSGVSFAASIQPIINANCAVEGCHNGNRGDIPDWSVKSNVIANASNIKSRTSSGTMPPPSSGRSLMDEEVALIACWVDDGAPDN